ncbi:MAG TPA: hypothetical protein VNN22_16440 [Verrucomicrobiae bacterium]|nr:hypothetical protein [Verrucomicrobiae bacterium]
MFGLFRPVQTLRHFVMLVRFVGLGIGRWRFRTLRFWPFAAGLGFGTLGAVMARLRLVLAIGAVVARLWLVAPVTITPVLTLLAFGTIRTIAAGLKLAQGAEQGFDLAFVRELLAFGKFDQLQNFLHVFQRVAQ